MHNLEQLIVLLLQLNAISLIGFKSGVEVINKFQFSVTTLLLNNAQVL